MFLAIFGFAYFLLKKRRRKKVRMINLRKDGKKERQINSYTMDSKTERERKTKDRQSVSQRDRESERQIDRLKERQRNMRRVRLSQTYRK
jgi:hypothetical protein